LGHSQKTLRPPGVPSWLQSWYKDPAYVVVNPVIEVCCDYDTENEIKKNSRCSLPPEKSTNKPKQQASFWIVRILRFVNNLNTWLQSC